MALTTNAEAEAVNRLLEFFLLPPLDPEPGRKPTTDDQARAAATLLAQSANRKLMAGIRPEQVAERWPGVPF